MEDRDINAAGLKLVKEFEGLRLQAYRDAAGVWTIGYGHTSRAGPPEVEPGQTITEEYAEYILRQDLQRFEAEVARLVEVPLNDNEFAALVSLCFNIGAGAFGSSTCLKRLNKGDRKGAAEALTWFNKAGGRRLRGLVRRRTAEKELFLTAPVARQTAGTFAQISEEEQRDQATRKHWLGSRTIVGTATAAAGAAGAASEVLDQTKGLFGSLGELVRDHPILIGCFAVVLIGLTVVVIARRDDWKKGRR